VRFKCYFHSRVVVVARVKILFISVSDNTVVVEYHEYFLMDFLIIVLYIITHTLHTVYINNASTLICLTVMLLVKYSIVCHLIHKAHMCVCSIPQTQ